VSKRPPVRLDDTQAEQRRFTHGVRTAHQQPFGDLDTDVALAAAIGPDGAKRMC
jgi:hypothetical protein